MEVRGSAGKLHVCSAKAYRELLHKRSTYVETFGVPGTTLCANMTETPTPHKITVEGGRERRG